jgi:hypothetical protein
MCETEREEQRPSLGRAREMMLELGVTLGFGTCLPCRPEKTGSVHAPPAKHTHTKKNEESFSPLENPTKPTYSRYLYCA